MWQELGMAGAVLAVFVATAGLPLPAEGALLFAGYLAGRDDVPLPLVIIAVTLASLIGSLAPYGAARKAGSDGAAAVAKRFGVPARTIERLCTRFEQHGGPQLALARLIPGLRTISSIPAALAGMPLRPYLGWSGIGFLAGCTVLVLVGRVAGSRWDEISAWATPVALVAGAIATLLLAVGWWRARSA